MHADCASKLYRGGSSAFFKVGKCSKLSKWKDGEAGCLELVLAEEQNINLLI